MLCAGEPYQLALACAWVYDSEWTTWSTELPWWNVIMILCLYLLVNVLYWCTVKSSTSLCLAVLFYVNKLEENMNNMVHRGTLMEWLHVM